MALSITHTTVAVGTDAGNGEIAKTQWNEAHTITGLGTGVETWLQTPSGANLASALTTALPASKGGTGLTALGSGVATWLGTPTSANLATAVTDALGTGKLIFSAGTLAVASGKTLTVSNTLTFTGTDASSVAFGAGGTVLYDTAISDTAYDATSWNGVTTIAPSKNAVRDQIEAMVALQASDTAYATSWDGVTTIPPSKNAVYDALQGTIHPAPIVGNWTILDWSQRGAVISNGGGLTLDTIYYTPILISRTITLSDLGARVQTGVASCNFAIAIYAHNASTGRPSGTPLAATGNLSGVSSNTTVTGDITGANVTLAPGIYWAAVWTDKTNLALHVYNNGAQVCNMATTIGSTTTTNVISGNNSLSLVTSAETYNASAWPNASSETFTESNGSSRMAVIIGLAA